MGLSSPGPAGTGGIGGISWGACGSAKFIKAVDAFGRPSGLAKLF